MEFVNVEDFKQVIRASQGIPDPQVDDLLERWREAKKEIIEMMGGEYIHRFPETYTFELSEKEKHRRFMEFVEMCRWKYSNYDLAKFLECCKDGFYNNMTPTDYFYGDIKIQKGSKIVKAFKFFEPDKAVLDELQSAASRIIQEDKISGQLCISVHPLDFLSSSENLHNWRSCHALDGEYRAGNLSYMVDKCTFMCYLQSDKEVYLSSFGGVKWNSKKWRVLMYLTEDFNILFAGRQYPFDSETGLDLVKNKISSLFNLQFNRDDWHEPVETFSFNRENITSEEKYIPIKGNRIKKLKHIVIDSRKPLHYNDLLKSTCYTPKFVYRKPKFYGGIAGLADEFTKMIVGGDVKCLCCGEQNITCSETMMCNNCECEYGSDINDDFAYCDCCGRRFFYEDGAVIHNGNTLLCDYCFEHEVQQCDYCGELYFSSDITYDRDSERYICYFCKEMD